MKEASTRTLSCVCMQYGNSPLLASIKASHTETAKLLIEKGADVNKFDKVRGFSTVFSYCNNNFAVWKSTTFGY